MAARILLLGAALAVIALFLVVPTVFVFAAALERGLAAYAAALAAPDTASAIRLTLLVAALAVGATACKTYIGRASCRKIV